MFAGSTPKTTGFMLSPDLLLDTDPETSFPLVTGKRGKCVHTSHTRGPNPVAPGQFQTTGSERLEPDLCTAIAAALLAVRRVHIPEASKRAVAD